MAKSKPQLLCCFGFSGKLRRSKPLKPAAAHTKRPFSWMRFHAKPPVRSALLADRSNPDSDRLAPGSLASTTVYKPPSEDLAAVEPPAMNQAGEGRPEKVGNEDVVEEIILETRGHSDTPKKPVGESQTRFSLTRRLESFRSGRFTKPVSPTARKDPITTNPVPAISKSLSFPALNPTRRVQVESPPTSMRVGLDGDEMSKKYRSAAAISIFIVTLSIMILWGRMCAILSTAAWILIVASLESIVEEDDENDFIGSDSYSEGLKKKLVILKGFLYRSQRENMLKKA
ncbi:uncharacterized protein LOC111020508 [Momordica charantia]|uniref:Uncharacterized protein LOC111020508 n=1 Tax=Momordica charantia TaxID=3673 RepID=A0A6J1DHG8_MOMCH|nr:uncharacterized protein LOC111020508 [Momordica charantia]